VTGHTVSHLLTVKVFYYAFYMEQFLHWIIFGTGMVTAEDVKSGTRDVSTQVHVHIYIYIFNNFLYFPCTTLLQHMCMVQQP